MIDLSILLAPPLAFVIYLALAAILSGAAHALASPEHESALKISAYASGEAAPTRIAAPGYRPFFIIALFFAVLHLGILMLGTSELSPIAGVFLVGLMLALIALILG